MEWHIMLEAIHKFVSGNEVQNYINGYITGMGYNRGDHVRLAMRLASQDAEKAISLAKRADKYLVQFINDHPAQLIERESTDLYFANYTNNSVAYNLFNISSLFPGNENVNELFLDHFIKVSPLIKTLNETYELQLEQTRFNLACLMGLGVISQLDQSFVEDLFSNLPNTGQETDAAAYERNREKMILEYKEILRGKIIEELVPYMHLVKSFVNDVHSCPGINNGRLKRSVFMSTLTFLAGLMGVFNQGLFLYFVSRTSLEFVKKATNRALPL